MKNFSLFIIIDSAFKFLLIFMINLIWTLYFIQTPWLCIVLSIILSIAFLTLIKFIGNKNVDPQEKINSVRAIYDKLNLAQRCHDLIDQYAQFAIAELGNVDIPDESKDFFVNLALKSCRREN